MKKVAKSEKKRRGKIIPAVGVGLMTLTSTACASMRAADANTDVRSTNVLMAEEEVSDVSLATFHVFDKEGPVRLAAGHGCGGGGGGCGHGGGGGCAHGGGGGCASSGPPLPPISALDKIIVAFAGPLFSFLLALAFAAVVMVVVAVVVVPVVAVAAVAVAAVVAVSYGLAQSASNKELVGVAH